LAADIDPNKCGFNINSETLNYIKDSLERGKFFGRRGLAERPVKLINRLYPVFEWEDIQQNLSLDFKEDMYLSASFFKWFRDFDIKERANRVSLTKLPKLLLYSLFDMLAPLSAIFPRQIQYVLRLSFNYFFSNKWIR